MFRSRKKRQEISLDEVSPLSEQRQWEIINEEALVASAKLVYLQSEVWNSTMQQLAEEGVFVRVDESVQEEMNALVDRLQATSLVAFELLDIKLPTTKAEQ